MHAFERAPKAWGRYNESRASVATWLMVIGTLSDRERELVALRFGADLTGPEIAELFGLTLANVQQILSRSLRRMRAQVEQSVHPPMDAG